MANSSPSPNAHPAPARPRSLRIFNRVGCLLLILIPVAFLVVSHLAKTSASDRRLQQEIARLKAAGVLVEPEDLIPTVPEGEPNAADVYRRAFSAYQVSQTEIDTVWDTSGGDPSRMDTVRDVVARHDGYFRLLDEASRIPACAFPVDWRHRASAAFPHLSDWREAVRMLVLRAQVLAADGDYDRALACISTSLRIADHAGSEPSIIGQFVAYAMRDIALDSLEATLSSGTPTPEASRRLFDQLSSIDQVGPSIRATQAEAIFLDLPLFDQVRSGQVSGGDLLPLTKHPSAVDEVVSRIYATVGSSWQNLDEIAYLQCVEKSLSALREPYPVLQQELAQIEAAVNQMPAHHTLLTRGMDPISIARRLGQSRERVAALIGAANIALAAAAYRVERGRYPNSLADLEAAGWELPKDPFTSPQVDFHYARDDGGFRIWSVGPDMDNDGGLTMQERLGSGLTDEQRQRAMDDGDYDISFRCQQ